MKCPIYNILRLVPFLGIWQRTFVRTIDEQHAHNSSHRPSEESCDLHRYTERPVEREMANFFFHYWKESCYYLLYFLIYLQTKMPAFGHLGYAYLSSNMHNVTTRVKSVFTFSNSEWLWHKFSKYLDLTVSQIETLAMYSFHRIFWLLIVIFFNVYPVVTSLNWISL